MSERPEQTTDEATAGFTPDRLPALRIGAWVLALFAVLAVSLIGLYQLFLVMARDEVYAQELRPVAADLVRQRDRDAALLGRYEVTDEKRGRYRIPIERALELLVADPSRLRPVAPAAASVPASAPAQASSRTPATLPAARPR
jgi:hypothetical protein